MNSLREKRGFQPRIEVLEERTTPTITLSPNGSTLNISSNNQADRVTIRDNGDGDLRVSFNGGSFQGNNFRRIRINMRGGDDRVTYTQTGARTRDMKLEVLMGAGNDLFTGSIQGPINAGRTLDIDVKGEGGADGIDLTANTGVNILSGATFRAKLSGGDDKDRVDFNYQGKIEGNLLYTLSGDFGDDNGAGFIRATVRADAGSTGFVGGVGETALVEGGFGDDVVSNFVIKLNPADLLLVSARVDGGLGTDVGSRTTNVVGVNNETEFVI